MSRVSSENRLRLQSAIHSQVENLESRTLFTVSFVSGSSVTLPALPDNTWAYERPLFGDFDNDAKTDLIISARSPTQGGPGGFLYFVKGNGDGSFAAPVLIARPVFNFEAGAGDLNGDGNLDLIVADFGADQLHVLTGKGDGTFNTAVSFATGDGPFVVQTADFNNDGLADVVTNNRQGNSLTVRLGDASAVLGAPTTIATDTDPSSITVGDFNGDGKADIASGNFPAHTITVFPGNGDGTFGTATSTSTAQAVVQGTGDFDKDGKLDIARGLDNSSAPSILFGNGDLTFRAAVDPAQTNLLSVADINLDGNLDLTFTGIDNSGNATVLTGKGDGTFDAPQSVAVNGPVGGLGAAGDLNGDGAADLAFAGGTTLVTALAVPPPSANLVPTTSGTLPTAVVGGDAGRLTVRITNSGNATFSGTVDVRLLVSADATVDSGDTEMVTKSLKLKLKNGKAKSVKLKFDYPSGLADGSYKVLAQVDPSGIAAQAPKTDDVAVAGAVTIAAPFVDLSTTFPSALAAGYKINKKSRVNVRLTNLGNVLAAGTATVSLYSSADTVADIGDTLLGSVIVKVKLKPQAGKTFKVSFKLPEGFAVGSSNLIATTSSTNLTDVSALNDIAVAAEPFTVIA